MFLSCSTIGGLRPGTSSEVFLAHQIRTLTRVSDAGYEYVELYYEPQPDWVQETILQTLVDFGLKAYSLHLPKFLFFFEEQEFTNLIEAVFPFIKRAGIDVAVLHLPSQKQIKRGDWKQHFDTLLEKARESECVLGLENVPYLPDAHLFIHEQIETHSPKHVGVTIDLEFMHLHGTPIESLMELFEQSVKNVHFRDSDGELVDDEGRRKYLNPGMGDIDLYNVVKTLHDSGYEKALTIEVSHRQKDNILSAKKFAEECLGKLDQFESLE